VFGRYRRKYARRNRMAFETQSVDTLKPSPYPSHALTRFHPDVGGFGSDQNQRVRGAANRLLADIRDLAPSIAARSAEIESMGRIPPDLVQLLKEIGIFRALVPKSHGGLELDLLSAFELMRELSRIDGSVGWNSHVGFGIQTALPLLGREMYDRLYQNGPDVVLAGSVQPVGTAEEVEGGWRVSGRWPFASGCDYADWIAGACVMTRNSEPLLGPTGDMPLTRLVVLPAHCWVIEKTWHAMGLKGSGSQHVVLRDALASAGNFISLIDGVPCIPGPLYTAPVHFIPLLHGPVAVGIAEAALNDIVGMARNGRKQLRAAKPMRETEIFQAELGLVQADLQAAKAYFEMQTASHWDHACAGTLSGESLMVEGTQAAIWVTQACLRVAERCFALGGGSAVYDSSPLQRRLRDLQTAAQHAAVQQRHYVDAGRLLVSGTGGA
jgi:alkylation response protein AidB-like acyl-CoA dehydrogenase